MRWAWLLAVTAAVFLWPAAASAEINQPSEIPSHLSGRDDLALQHSALLKQWKALEQKIAAHNAECGQIQEDSPRVDFCRSNQAKILSEIKAYNARLRQYEDALAQAAAAPTSV